MKKKILAFVTGFTLVSSIGFAAPLNNLSSGETAIGYDYYNMSHSADNNSYYLESAVSDKFTLGIERNNYTGSYNDNWNSTDVYAQYKLDPNIRLIVGNRDYDYSGSKVYVGVGATTNLAPKLDGYASVISSSYTTEWQAGVNYALNDNVSLNVNYKNNKDDHYPTYSGLGVGLNYKF